MPRNNKRGGKKHKRGRKFRDESFNKKNVELAEDNQEYAKVIKKLGGTRLLVKCTDGKERQAVIRGKFQRRVWMNPGDILLVNTIGFGNDNACYIDKKYNSKEISVLQQKGLLDFDEEEDEDQNVNCVFKTRDEMMGVSKVPPQNFRGFDISFDSEDETDSYSY